MAQLQVGTSCSMGATPGSASRTSARSSACSAPAATSASSSATSGASSSGACRLSPRSRRRHSLRATVYSQDRSRCGSRSADIRGAAIADVLRTLGGVERLAASRQKWVGEPRPG